VVMVWSDFTVPTEMDNIRIDVQGPTDTRSIPFQLTTGNENGKTKLPVQIVLVPPDNGGFAFDVTATGLLGSEALVSQEARLSFIPGQSRVLTLFLARACHGVTCSGNNTCSSGSCDQPIDVDASSLPVYDPSAVFAPPDAGAESRLDAGTDTGVAEGGAEAGRPDAIADGPKTGDSATDRAADAPVSSPDSHGGAGNADTGDTNNSGQPGDTGGTGGTGGSPTVVDAAPDVQALSGNAPSDAQIVPGDTVPDVPVIPADAPPDARIVPGDTAPDVPVSPADTPLDVPVPACGGPGYPCCAPSTCTGGGCCVVNSCVANGATCSTGGSCAGGSCVSSATVSAAISSLQFGAVATGQSSNVLAFTITNTGQQTSGDITVNSSSTQFAIETGATGDCVSDISTLAQNSGCTVRIVFTPTAVGSYSGTITYSASPGGGGTVNVTGSGVLPSCALGTAMLGSCTLGT